MTLITEDGSIVAGANGYISVAELDAYWLDRNVNLKQTSAQKESAIIIATQYVNLNNNWKGSITVELQPLDWPRYGVVDDERRTIPSDTIPEQLKAAIAEYARREMDNTGGLQPDVSDTGAVKKVRKKVDVIETETEYQDGTGGYFGTRRYPLADNYLKGLVRAGGLGRIGGC